ncbi:thiol peroxidase [Confluentibacter lentus]|uniref:thiol peroxidase n=1 Tax=Confluentibacter lentus TaxID=1699412 RepID=UPI000C28B4F8|nr:thiol peroxidase [Confluentibacter lentus]
MAIITLGGNQIETSGNLPSVGSKALDFELVALDLSTKTLKDFKGSHLILNIFPSVNTRICSSSVRAFNKTAASLNNAKVLCISRDLPFAQKEFCAAEGIDNVVMLSDFKTAAFGKNYGLLITTGSFDALLSRCIIIIDKNGTIIYTEQVPEIGQEPNYEAALKALVNE